MAAIVMKEQCPKCKGTGIDVTPGSLGQPGPEKPCENCGATGFRETGQSEDLGDRLDGIDTVLNDLASAVSDVMDKCNDIKAVVDAL